MRTLLHTLVLIISTSLLGAAQAASTPQTATTPPASKPVAVAPAEPTAIIHTTVGDLHCTLFPKVAPIGVQNFIGLANGTKDWTSPVSHAKKHGVALYDGTIFHRVIPEFMIQGGDPKGDGTGDPGYEFKNETSPTVTFDRPGRMAYANAGPDTNGSQFFITELPYPSLNGKYTIFGQCDDAAVELVKKIARMATDGETPLRPVKITHIEIHGAGASTAKAAAPKPSAAVK
ncbi:MAG: peptidylprolyl isomerase [Terriglobales bacterium]|jgi:peptidyl-prolyl cis-trans isomerase A (cyclophilin A)